MQVFLILILFLQWDSSSQPAPIVAIEFSSVSRGFQRQVFISADSLTQIVDGRGETNRVQKRKLQEGEWNALQASLASVKLSAVEKLPSPTSRRAFDGARHSTIKLTDKDGNEASHSFDDENPHEQLKPLMDQIKAMVELRSEKP